jgi:hypothetical protein
MAIRGVAGVSNLSKVYSDLLNAFGGDTAKVSAVLNNPQVFQGLVDAGVITTTGLGAAATAATVAAPVAAAAAAPAVAATAAGGGGLLGSALGGGAKLAGALGLEVAAEKIAGGLLGGTQPTQYPTGVPSGASKYFFSPELGLSYQQYYESVIPRVRALNAISERFGLGPIAEEPVDPQSFATFQAQLSEKQAESLSNRRVREIMAEKQFDYLSNALQAQSAVRQQQVKSLGDIQRQRVESGYTAAQGIMESALQNVLARERFENNSAISELAKPV